MTPEELHIAHDIAREFHREYERLAPAFDKTRTEPTIPWEYLPSNEKVLRVAVVGYLLNNKVIALPSS